MTKKTNTGKGAASVAAYFKTGVDRYALLAAGLRVGMGAVARSDITGNQGTGAGALVLVSASDAPGGVECNGNEGRAVRAVRIHPARAVGVGSDAETTRADDLSAWLCAECESDNMSAAGAADLQAARADILADIASESEHGRAVLTLAGGKGYGFGRRVILTTSGGMAARAARFVWRKHLANGRDNRPSDTSLQEAAAAAAAAVALHLGQVALRLGLSSLDALPLDVWQDRKCLLRVRDYKREVQENVSPLWIHQDQITSRFRQRQAARAWRAARRSLVTDSQEGRTGRRQGQDKIAVLPLDAAQLEFERQSLEAWASGAAGGSMLRDEHARELATEQRGQRRAVLRWFASVLAVKASGRTGAAERARFSVLARLVSGRDIATAARGAGFASGRAALESFRAGKVWDRLRATASGGADVARLQAARRTAGKAARAAVMAQRATRAGCGAVLVGVKTRSLGQSSIWTCEHEQAGNWRTATAARAATVATAHGARRQLAAAQAARRSQFDTATKGLRAGWMR